MEKKRRGRDLNSSGCEKKRKDITQHEVQAMQ